MEVCVNIKPIKKAPKGALSFIRKECRRRTALTDLVAVADVFAVAVAVEAAVAAGLDPDAELAHAD